MRYRSTRGGVSGLSFEEALISGYASDGGILLPESIPTVSKDTLKAWAALSYPQLVKQIIPYFVSPEEIPLEHLDGLLDRAFSQFSCPEVVTVARLKEDLNILELFHGPTKAFKDLALSCVGQFLEYFLAKRQRHTTILVGTSGDTGSAAITGVRGLRWVDIVVLLPRGRCTQIQELQMTTVIEDNVHVYRVDGTSDDLDHPIKQCFMDTEFVKRHNLMSINSINWARILIQIAHYFYAYLQMCPECDREVEIVVPTGACGNVTSGVIAREMGLPIHFVCAVNVNDIVARTMSAGDFSKAPSVLQTLASAMDIQVPYNMERLMYIFSNGDTELVSNLMTEMEANGQICMPDDLHQKMKAVIRSHRVSDADIRATMRRCLEENNYLLCPHTAVAVHYIYNSQPAQNRICIATASPAKFAEAVESAGLTPQPTPEIRKLTSMPTRYMEMENGEDWEAILRQKIGQITSNLTI